MGYETYIFAGGGTGGHLYPGLAVARKLGELKKSATLVFACSSRAIDRRILDPLGFAVVPQPILPMPRSPRGWGKFVEAWVASRKLARRMLNDIKPTAVLGLGGFAAAAMVKQAASMRIPSALLNPDAVPGVANRLLARRVDAVFTQFESTAQCFAPRTRAKVRVVGCPIRDSLIGADKPSALRELKLRGDRLTLLVNGGSLGAESINRVLAMLSEQLCAFEDTWQILHVTGPNKASGDDLRCSNSIHVSTLEYCPRMELAYACADLAIGRGGASSVAELAATGTPAIILPYPHHKDRQQLLNARELADNGGAIVVEDRSDPRQTAEDMTRTLIPLLGDPQNLKRMRQAALACAKPTAADVVAQWMASAGV